MKGCPKHTVYDGMDVTRHAPCDASCIIGDSLDEFAAMSDNDGSLHPAIYVEPKDKLPGDEDSRQATFIATMKRTAKACRVYAVPNGGKRTRWAAAKAKREGMAKGWPDVGIVWADGEARIEFKAARTMPDDDQLETLNWLHLRGHRVAVCRTAEGALRWLREIGAPVPTIKGE